MVTILPRFDPGGEIGKSIGSGIGSGLENVAERKRVQRGLDELKDLDLENMSYGDIISTASRSFANVQGGSQVLQDLLPSLLKQKQSIEYANSFPGDEDESVPGGSVDPDETEQMIEKSTPGYGKAGAQGGTGERPELAPSAQKVPGLEEDVPSYTPMSNNERRSMAQRMRKGNFSPKEIQEAINLEEDRRLNVWKGRVEAKKARTEQFTEERGFEDLQEDRVRGYISEELGIAPNKIDPYEMQKGYEFFKNEQKKSPNKKDRQLWIDARQEFNSMRDSFSNGEGMLERPGFLSLNAPQRVNSAKQWAQEHLKKYGNFRQDREKLMTMFMDNGFTKGEASSIVKPLSKGLENVVKGVGKGTETTGRGYQGVGEREVPLSGDTREKYINSLATDIANNLQGTDSLVLLREKLLRDKGVDEQMFSEALQQAQQMMGQDHRSLSPDQSMEIPYLKEKVKPSLMDIIIGDEKFDIRKYIPRFAK